MGDCNKARKELNLTADCCNRGRITERADTEYASNLRSDLRTLLRQVYLAGFNATGEGYNAEYPFEQKDLDPEDDTDWCEKRDNTIKSIMGETK